MVMVVTMIVVNKKNFFIIIIFDLIFYNSFYAGAKIQKNMLKIGMQHLFVFAFLLLLVNIDLYLLLNISKYL